MRHDETEPTIIPLRSRPQPRCSVAAAITTMRNTRVLTPSAGRLLVAQGLLDTPAQAARGGTRANATAGSRLFRSGWFVAARLPSSL